MVNMAEVKVTHKETEFYNKSFIQIDDFVV